MQKTTNLPELSKIMEEFKRESETLGLQATNPSDEIGLTLTTRWPMPYLSPSVLLMGTISE